MQSEAPSCLYRRLSEFQRGWMLLFQVSKSCPEVLERHFQFLLNQKSLLEDSTAYCITVEGPGRDPSLILRTYCICNFYTLTHFTNMNNLRQHKRETQASEVCFIFDAGHVRFQKPSPNKKQTVFREIKN